ncbi:TPA: hypothetical protein ACQ31I_003900 [Yersinia enterocolitica]
MTINTFVFSSIKADLTPGGKAEHRGKRKERDMNITLALSAHSARVGEFISPE